MTMTPKFTVSVKARNGRDAYVSRASFADGDGMRLEKFWTVPTPERAATFSHRSAVEIAKGLAEHYAVVDVHGAGQAFRFEMTAETRATRERELAAWAELEAGVRSIIAGHVRSLAK